MVPNGAEDTAAAAAGKETEHANQNRAFPAGLRVLLVDDDPVCLMVIGQMLRACQYEVCTCSAAASALDQLRGKKETFDLVLSDVYMPDMDGFKLLEIVGLELGLPVIMMSANDEHSTVMRGVTHGACDFLIKPVRIEELKNIWQHVVRRGKHNAAAARDAESDDAPGDQDADSNRKRTVHSRDGSCNDGQQQAGGREEEGAASKKPRVVWSVDMHQQFVHAVNQLGIDKAVPKKILELMKVDGLTRENVASHLQKYRLYLKRVQQNAPAAPAANGPASAAAAAAAGVGSGSFSAALGMPGMMGPNQMMWGNSTQVMDAMQVQQQAAATAAVGQQAQQVQQPPQQPGQQQLGGMGAADAAGMGPLMGMMPAGGMLSPMGAMMPGMLMGMQAMAGMPAMNPLSSMGPAAAAGGMMGLPGMPGFGAAMMGIMPGMPGMPVATQGMAMNPLAQLPGIRPGMPGDPAAVMAMMSANMQTMFQVQQAAAAAALPTSSGGGSSGGMANPQQQQQQQHQQQQQQGQAQRQQGMQPSSCVGLPSPAAAAAGAGTMPGMMPGLAGVSLKQEPNCGLRQQSMPGAGMVAAMQQPAAAAAASMAAPAMQQQQQHPPQPGLLGGSSGGGSSMAMPAGQQQSAAAAAAPLGLPDFRNVFDDVFDVPPAARAVAAGGGGGQGGAVEDELLDFILKGS